MSAPQHTTMLDLVGRQSRDVDARLAAHPDREHLAASRVTAADLLDQRLHNSLDLRWDGEHLLARRGDSISEHYFTVRTADGVLDVERLWRWAREMGLVTDDITVTDDTPARVADGVVAIAQARHAPGRVWPRLSVADVAARRFQVPWACRLDEHGQVVGHERSREPSAKALAEHADRLAAMASPVNKLMLRRRPASPWPADRPITPELIASHAANVGLMQTTEPVPDWAEVLACLARQLAEPGPQARALDRLTMAGAIARRLLVNWEFWVDADGDLVGRERGSSDEPGRVTAAAVRDIAQPLVLKSSQAPRDDRFDPDWADGEAPPGDWSDVVAAIRSEVDRP